MIAATPDDSVRQPGTAARLALFLAAVAGGAALVFLGFPPGASDRLPVLVVTIVLALVSAGRGDRGLTAFAFLFPSAGALARFFGGVDAMAWPVLLFAGLVAGWTFRFVYDFETRPERSTLDGALTALTAVWLLAAGLAWARARTLWAVRHGLSLRAVDVLGVSDAVAVRESVFALATVAAGAAFFFLLRRSADATRRRAASAALLGVGLSAALAVLERFGWAPPEASPFWRMTGRLSGGAADPNSLGLLSALALVFAVLAYGRAPRSRLLLGLLLAAFLAGLFLSGSRSALLLVLFAAASVLLARGVPAGRRAAAGALAAAVLLAAVLVVSRAAPGTLGSRLAETFDPSLAVEYRVSARPLLWSCAFALFAESPVSGVGLGAFSWRLPDVLAARGASLPARDNPGSAYVQALAETGLPGFLLTLLVAWRLARSAAARLSVREPDPAAAGGGAASLAFLLALVFGSHWFAPDVCLLFFLFASLAADRAPGPDAPAMARLRSATVAVYGVAALVSALATVRAEEAFRYGNLIGFHPPESGQSGTFRWTRKAFAVDVAPGASRRLTLVHYTPQAESVLLEAFADGRRVFDRSLAPGESTVLRLSAPPERARAVIFRLSRAFVPKDLGLGEDRRQLGLVALVE